MKTYEDGKTKEEYNSITEKYFGLKIADFNNGMTETIPGTDRVRGTGWSFDNSVYMVLNSPITQNTGGTYTGDFLAYNVSDGFWNEGNQEYLLHVKEYLLTGNDEAYPKPSSVRVVFELVPEMRDGVQYQ